MQASYDLCFYANAYVRMLAENIAVILKYSFLFSQKIGVDISCKLETIRFDNFVHIVSKETNCLKISNPIFLERKFARNNQILFFLEN